MKNILSLSLIALLIVACAKIEQQTYFKIQLPYGADNPLLEFDARGAYTGGYSHGHHYENSVSISTNILDWEKWEWAIDYQTPETDWLTIKKVSENRLTLAVKVNTGKNERRARVVFNVKADAMDDNYLDVTQSAFYLTKEEQQMIDACNIVKKVYSSVNIEADFDTICPNLKTGRFRYYSSGNSVNIPITFNTSSYSSDVRIETPDKSWSEYPRVSGTIYTDYSSSHNKGDFDITLSIEYGVSIKFTQAGN